MRLEDIMSKRVVTIGPEEDAAVARRRMQRERIRHLVVVDDGQVVGVLSARDVVVPETSMVREGTVEELMAAEVVTADQDTTLSDAAKQMQKAEVGCLPVLDGERLAGIVTATDVLDELGRESAALARRSRPRVKAARARPRRHDTPRRAPLAARKPRAVKRRAGRTAAPQVPAHVRVFGAELEEIDRDYIRRKLGMQLGKFAESIERVSVRVEDVNGPRGGVDQMCRIKVVLSGLPSVVFEAQDTALHAAIDRAIKGTERAVRRSVGRRRKKPMTLRSYGERASATMRG